jgi:hypothetical protein
METLSTPKVHRTFLYKSEDRPPHRFREVLFSLTGTVVKVPQLLCFAPTCFIKTFHFILREHGSGKVSLSELKPDVVDRVDKQLCLDFQIVRSL